jgi:hypothetical protein
MSEGIGIRDRNFLQYSTDLNQESKCQSITGVPVRNLESISHFRSPVSEPQYRTAAYPDSYQDHVRYTFLRLIQLILKIIIPIAIGIRALEFI